MGDVYPLPKQAKVIGTPYSGTHGKAFNQRGGSDNWESENAVDLATPVGTPVYAVADGTIGPQIGLQGGGRFAGLRVHLVAQGNEFYYAHLSKLTVKAGQLVTAGQLIGYSGEANGVAHLHFAAKNGNPEQVLGDPTAPEQTQPQQPQATADTSSRGFMPPAPSAVPTDPGAPQPDVELPGSQSYTIGQPHFASSLWSQVNQGEFVSPEAQMLGQNAQVAAG